VHQATAVIVSSCDKNVISVYGNTKNKSAPTSIPCRKPCGSIGAAAVPSHVCVFSIAPISTFLSTRIWPTPLQPPDEGDLREYIESLSSVLNPHERRAVELMAEGYTPDEMARELGIKPHSAIQLRYRIIAKLRNYYRTENKKE